MAVERTLDDAHKLLSQGKVDRAIAAYAGVVAARPDDWPAANRLGDLYVQTGQVDRAVEQFAQVAQHLFDRQLLPKAAALYKKMLRVSPEDEFARLQLADISERRGLLVDAREQLDAVLERRRDGGDDEGVREIEDRLAQLGAGASATAETEPPSHRWGTGPDTLVETAAETTEMVPKSLATDPIPVGSSTADPSGAMDPPGPVAPAEAVVPTAQGRQQQLRFMLIENEISVGRITRARQLLSGLLASTPEAAAQVVDLAKRMALGHAEATIMCAEVLLEAATRHDDWRTATATVRDLAAWVHGRPEAGQWEPEQFDRLARTEAAARLQGLERERAEIAQVFPDITRDASDEDDTADSPEPAVAAAV